MKNIRRLLDAHYTRYQHLHWKHPSPIVLEFLSPREEYQHPIPVEIIVRDLRTLRPDAVCHVTSRFVHKSADPCLLASAKLLACTYVACLVFAAMRSFTWDSLKREEAHLTLLVDEKANDSIVTTLAYFSRFNRRALNTYGHVRGYLGHLDMT